MGTIPHCVCNVSHELSLSRCSLTPGYVCRGPVPGPGPPSDRPPRPPSETSCLLVEKSCSYIKNGSGTDLRQLEKACGLSVPIWFVLSELREGCQGELVCHGGAHISSQVMDLASTLSFETAACGVASSCPFAFLPFSTRAWSWTLSSDSSPSIWGL